MLSPSLVTTTFTAPSVLPSSATLSFTTTHTPTPVTLTSTVSASPIVSATHGTGFTPSNSPVAGLQPEILLDPDAVIKKYPKYLNLASAGRLAVRLSCESYFGKELLKKCTVIGCNDKPPLPKEKVAELKTKMLSLFPQFLSSPVEFEPIWTKCVAAINHCCAGLQEKDPPIPL